MTNKTSREREREREQLQQDINNLTNKPNKTPQEQQDLTNKKKQLEELEKKGKNTGTPATNNKEPFNWKPWAISGLILIGVIGLGIYLTKKPKTLGKK